MKKKLIFGGFVIIFTMLIGGCREEGVKLTREDRDMIDTLANRQIVLLTAEYDRWCRDSSLIIRQRMVDSLVIVREQEILKQTPTPQY